MEEGGTRCHNKYVSTLMNSRQGHWTVKESKNHTLQKRRERRLIQGHFTSDQRNLPGIQSSPEASRESLPTTSCGLRGRTPSACSAPSLPPSQLPHKTETGGEREERGRGNSSLGAPLAMNETSVCLACASGILYENNELQGGESVCLKARPPSHPCPHLAL